LLDLCNQTVLVNWVVGGEGSVQFTRYTAGTGWKGNLSCGGLETTEFGTGAGSLLRYIRSRARRGGEGINVRHGVTASHTQSRVVHPNLSLGRAVRESINTGAGSLPELETPNFESSAGNRSQHLRLQRETV
jgi:hypothetical protein